MATPHQSSGPTTPAQALESFVQRTGMHAVPSIATERSRPSRLGWSFLLLIAACFLFYQIFSICEKIRSYPTSTVTTVKYDSPMTFPAVTFCNLNPLRLEQVQKLTKANDRLVRSPQDGNKNKNPNGGKEKKRKKAPGNKKIQSQEQKSKKKGDRAEKKKKRKDRRKKKKEMRKQRIKIRKKKKKKKKNPKQTLDEIVGLVDHLDSEVNETTADFDRKKQDTKNLRADTVRKNRVMYLMNTLPDDIVKTLTYDLMDIVVDCSFQGKNCDFQRDFVRIMNPRYGACYIFNSGMNQSKFAAPVKQIFNSGADNGLELTLFVDTKNYLPEVAPVAGYKLLVHDQASPPIPDQDGFMLKPGAFTMLGLRSSEIERAVDPYGNCKHFSKSENESMNMYLDSLPLTSPTKTTCMRTCEQLEILSNCECFSLQHGYSSAPAFSMYNDSRDDPCSLDDENIEYQCMQSQLEAVNSKGSSCKTKMCKNHECFSKRYEVSQSIASWPTKNSFSKIQKSFKKMSIDIDNFKRLVTDVSPNAEPNFSKNFLKVMVYFEDLNVINIKTLPSYTWIDFLSDLGGQGGLWLGMSAFTIIEVLVLLIEMCRLSVFYCLKKRGSTDRDPPSYNAQEIALRSKEDDHEENV